MKRSLMVTMVIMASVFFIIQSCGDSGATTPGNDEANGNDQNSIADNDTAVADNTLSQDTQQPDTNDNAGKNDTVAANDESAADEDTFAPDEDSAGPAFQFDGTWAQRNIMTANTSTNVAVIGDIKAVSVTEIIQIMKLKRNGDKVSVTTNVCSTKVDSGTQYVTINISDAYIKSLATAEYEYELAVNGAAYNVHQPKYTIVNGAHLVNNETDTLPTDKADSRVFDQDKDTKPGMTINAVGNIPVVFSGAAEMYIVQRGTTIMDGVTKGTDTIEGGIIWTDEQSILDVTNATLKNEKTVTPDPAKSSFRSKKIDDSWTCVEILANKATIFGN